MTGLVERIRGRAIAEVRTFGARALIRLLEPPVTIQTVRDANPRAFDDLVETIRAAGTTSLAVCGEDYHLEGGLRLQQRSNEFAALCLFLQARRPRGSYLEIGSASGGTCQFLQGLLDSPQILSIDDGEHPDAGMQSGCLAGLQRVSRHIGDSHAPAAKTFIQDNLTGPIAVALIDGDHTYDGVRRDTKLVLPFARPGTLLVYHDTVAVPDVSWHWALGMCSGLFVPVAHFVDERPGALGIGVARVVSTTRLRTVWQTVGERF